MPTTGQNFRFLRVKCCPGVRIAEEGINITRTPYIVTLYVRCLCLLQVFSERAKKLHGLMSPSENTFSKHDYNLSLFTYLANLFFFLSKTNHQLIVFSRQDQLLFSIQVTALTAHLLLVHTLRMRGAVPPYTHISPWNGA